MKTLPRAPLAYAILLAAAAMSACGGALDEEGESQSALCNGCEPPLPPPPAPPPPPPAGVQRTVTITTDDLQGALFAVLHGAKLRIDTTKTGPSVIGPPQAVANPAYAECQRELAACAREPVAQRAMCRADVNERCAGIPSSTTVYSLVYSYFEFNAFAKSEGATDVLFPLETIHHTGVINCDVDLNNIEAVLDNTNWTAYFSPGFAQNSGPLVTLALWNIHSASPTAILTGTDLAGTVIGVPDVELTTMEASVSLGRLVPTADKQGIDYQTADGSFYSEHDVSLLPEWLVNLFYDVEAKIRTKVEARLEAAFDKSSTHAAISKALTRLVSDAIKRSYPAGYLSIDQVTASGSSIIVTYTKK